MIVAGAFATGVSVACLIIAARRPSDVERWIQRLGVARVPRIAARTDTLVVARITAGACGGLAGAAVAWWLGTGPVPIPVAAYVGALLPVVAARRREAARQNEAAHGVVTLVEGVCALVAAGRPVENAFLTIASRGTTSTLLDAVLAQTTNDYTLGVSLHRALTRAAAGSRIASLGELAARLEQARELGRGAGALLADLRDDLRAAERARALRAAAGVEGKLMLVVTLCYLPALALLVIVPLFVTLLAGLFG